MLALLFGLLGCVDDPCAGATGARLQVAPPGSAEAQSNPRAFRSISDALAVAEPGASICVAPGLYRETLRLDTEDVRLLGAGPDRVVVEPRVRAEDPDEAEETVLAILADRTTVRGIALRGGARGVWIDAGLEATLGELQVSDNATGILAINPGAIVLESVDIVHNSSVGGLIVSTEEGPGLRIVGGRIAGNGSLAHSEVGGLYSERSLTLAEVELRDNAGTLAADLYTPGTLVMEGGLLRRPWSAAETPRIYAGDGARLSAVEAHIWGGPLLRVRCEDASFEAQNLAIADLSGEGPALRIEGCESTLQHLTVLNQSGRESASPFTVDAESHVTVRYAALVGYAPVEDWDEGPGAIQVRDGFSGSVTAARLMAPLDIEPDLRPQPDSPLIDAAEGSTLSTDLRGTLRPAGAAPDLGAFELP